MGEAIRGRIFSNITVFNGLAFERDQSLLIDCKGKASFGPTPDVKGFTPANLQEIDGTGLTVTPSFHDTHMHLLSYAANLLAYDIGLGSLSKEVFIRSVRKAARDQRNADVVRVSGMDHGLMNMPGNLPVDNALLDEALSERPLRIQTRSGHAHVLNSAAMHLAGIGDSTDEPEGVTFQRHLSDGRLNGVFLEAGEYLDNRLPVIGQFELRKGLGKAFSTIHAHGINDLTDATHFNDVSRYQLLSEYLDEYAPNMELLFMLGFHSLRDFVDLGMKFRSRKNGITVGPVKIMLTNSSGSIYPDESDLKEIVRECHSFGFPVAIHSIDKDSTDIVINVLSDDFLAGDRIEHASELTDDQIHKMSVISLNVSTQPSFIYERGDGYLNSDAASRINKLYRLNSLLSAGIVVGASSDCPVTSPDPIKTVYSSVTRQTSSGATVNIEERVTVCEALKMLTTNSVTISGLTQVRDWTDKNLILIDNDLDSCSDEELLQANISWISDFE